MNKKCQVFTPPKYVKRLLDNIGYRKNLYGMKVAENSCGDGNVLVEIVERYILDAIREKIPLNTIRQGLETDIYGAEIDEIHFIKCIDRLDEIALKYSISNIKWNIFYGDFLKQNITEKFDFVIGNPPYISYLEMDMNLREYLRENFTVCKKGKFDICYAFIEAGIKSLNPTGKLAYLIPGNIFKNQFANELREFMLPHLKNICDYTSSKLFKDKLTSSAIIICEKNNICQKLMYHDVINKKSFNINKNSLNDKWQFKQIQPTYLGKTRFGDLFNVSSTVATLYNKAFIVGEFSLNNNTLCVEDYQLELKGLKKAVSPRSLNYKKEEYVIFPYYYESGKLCRYSEMEFEKNFPEIKRYLMQYYDKLKERDNDKGISWFEYGRSQALAHLNQKKLLVSTLITNGLKVYLLDKDTIPTSGLYIVPKKQAKLSEAKKILESQHFFEYVKSIGVISNGNSFRISPKDIMNYQF